VAPASRALTRPERQRGTSARAARRVTQRPGEPAAYSLSDLLASSRPRPHAVSSPQRAGKVRCCASNVAAGCRDRAALVRRVE
jgi:hypothetical protein